MFQVFSLVAHSDELRHECENSDGTDKNRLVSEVSFKRDFLLHTQAELMSLPVSLLQFRWFDV